MTTPDDSSATADSAEIAAFRDRVREFFARECGPYRIPESNGDESGDSDATMADLERADVLPAAKAYQKALTDAGLAFLTWPKPYGGGLTKRHQEVFLEESAAYALPTTVFTIGHGMCAPTILEFGTEAQRARHLPALLSGEKIWCQLYSEPGAGSDVASLQTRAVRDGDEWTVNGQKVWTSGAHYSEWGILIARTNVDAPKHKGITMFIIDMKSPGIEIRPLRQITGGSNFNEVYFTDVRIPHENVLGDVDDGWRLSVSLLMNERVAIGSSGSAPRLGGIGGLVRLAGERGVLGDRAVRQGLADLYIQNMVVAWNSMRTRAALKAGRAPGPEGSLNKVANALISRRRSDLAIRIAGAGGQAWDPADARGGRWADAVLGAPGAAIAGGTTEIQKGIIGERVLGLPKEPQVDRDLPFRELKVGTQR